MTKSDLEETLLFQLRGVGIPDPVREYKALLPRKFRFDFAWPEFGVLVEVQGGTFSGGRHTRGVGYESDCEKLNEAMRRGYEVYWMTRSTIESGKALQWIEAALGLM